MITSVKNETVKQWNKLKIKKHREQQQQFLVEGVHLVQEVLASDWEVETIILQDGVTIPIEVPSEKSTYVTENVMQHLTDTKTPQGIVAIVRMKESDLKNKQKLLLLDAIQDPGNVGTMIRTADAAGFDGIVLGDGTVDLYNDKVIRSSQGSIFHLPILRTNLLEYTQELKQGDITIWGSTLEQASPIHELKVPKKVALIVGNEGAGVSQELLKEADQRVHIPIFGQAESLNVSVATGIMLYQIVTAKQ
ncbi:putative tRNA/rRNA methyltransferase YsgA [Paraliobacillus quinghaiensis]|uniref:tRNA/rRNA methyltransferase YsgA n=1 Tax=Paraliobacillus quinghaiensis TaxID=470815 RepID=A0A917WS71_9BACI|nr:RNA methyltransferase [Paraliobacillus quinghaiensis]GGM26917.1 putative tRNA/rRNA methyltransferase YsgA [Paraliobacillus quinghaiensis]